MLFITLALFVVALRAQSNPTNLICENVVIRPSQWESKFPITTAFNGFFKADGNLRFLAPTGETLLAINLDNSIWHQYYNSDGLLMGDLFLSGAAFGFPGVVVLTSRQVTNPMFAGERICQKFLVPSPQDLIDSYSELVNHGRNYMESKYFSLDNATAGLVFANEFFVFDAQLKNAFSETNTYVLGSNGSPHFIFQSVNFRYTPITEAQATALGWNGNVASVPASQRGLRLGRGAVSVSLLNAQQRALVGL